jgi:ABC-2 type transport system permease protein
MMLSGPFGKGLRDRLIPFVIASASLGLLLLGGMAIYRSFDLSIYRDLPVAIREMFGLGGVSSVAQLSFGAMYVFMGALTMCGTAIAAGSALIAGEERQGTIGMLLVNPVSRGEVLLRKSAALLLLVTLSITVLWIAALLSPAVLGVDATGLEVGALMIHMLAVSVFFGLLAFAVGALTGSPSVASGTAAAVLVVSYFAVGVLPVVGLEQLAPLFPWHYFNGNDPLTRGIDLGHLAVLAAASAALLTAGWWGFRRRDLRERTAGTSVFDRLRKRPAGRLVIGRIQGSTRVSGIFAWTVSRHQGLLGMVALTVFVLGIWTGQMYDQIDQGLSTLTESLPDSVLALEGGVDMSTAAGWLTGEMYSSTVPVAVIALGVVVGSRAIAGEERARTMGLLLANPVSRRHLVLQKSMAMFVLLSVLGVVTFCGVLAGSELGGLDVPPVDIAGMTLLAVLLGAVFGTLALALGAATGSSHLAGGGAAGAAVLAYLTNWLFPLSESLEPLARISPFHYYLDGAPLAEGVDPAHVLVLALLSAGLTVAASALFQKRDLR